MIPTTLPIWQNDPQKDHLTFTYWPIEAKPAVLYSSTAQHMIHIICQLQFATSRQKIIKRKHRGYSHFGDIPSTQLKQCHLLVAISSHSPVQRACNKLTAINLEVKTTYR
ncbi:hypothetical protein CDL12_21623 [Handroanthus impetiginosus]|uniref:Uncharacterized protein n=1 Tax=Handroanthus impetiginosus TaxID=429701 RepID=A0A2G9GKK5_9LAMI|nr:hypothetical protein CDL12_21623 [Handroanthus impetiginosus]